MKILVAVHKNYPMPADDIYYPVFVGAELSSEKMPAGFTADNTGKNISLLNPYYNELTALYWAKYNLTGEDVIGLAHYRRYLGKKASHNFSDLLTKESIDDALQEVDVLLPKARNYFIESQETHYLNAHAAEPFYAMTSVLERDYAEYMPAFRTSMNSSKAHLFNMSIMRQSDFQAYTDFLFDVLTKVSQVVDVTKLDGQDKRSLGFLAERLMDIWLVTNKKTYREFPIVTTERTNWVNKAFHFFKRKFLKSGSKKVHF